MDMHSGGRTKIRKDDREIEYVYVEASSLEDGIEIFEKTFNRDPYNVTCDRSGEDYSISTHDSLDQATAYDRHCAYEGGKWVERPTKYYDKVIPLQEYLQTKSVLVMGRVTEMSDTAIRASLIELE